MKKERRYDSDYGQVNKFIDILKNIDYSKSSREVFNDWVIMASAALYSWKKDNKVEEEYKQIVKKYSEEQISKLTELLGILMLRLEKRGIDFLGNVFSILGLSDKGLSQYFTPYHIARFMADMTFTNKDIKKEKIIKICDPSCGSGVMLIAIIDLVEKQKSNLKKNILLVGKDIDSRCALMTFIQLSILKAAAIVICGDSLTNKVIWMRETIWYHEYNIEERLIKQEEKEQTLKPQKTNNKLLENLFQKKLF